MARSSRMVECMEWQIDEQRIDWVTCYARNGPRADLLEAYASRSIELEQEAGDRLKRSAAYGFHGHGTRHCRVGRGAYGVLVRAGGQLANELYPHLAILSDHVSRVDYCVTATARSRRANPVRALARAKAHDDKEHPSLPSITVLDEIWGGKTCYIGDRESAVFARVYDKHKESNGEYPEGSWRWELELKRYASEFEHRESKQLQRTGEEIRGIVNGQFAAWGLCVPWNFSDSPERWRAPARLRDVDRTAQWLLHQVAPGAQRVAGRYGRDYVMALLGFIGEDPDRLA